MKRTFTSHVEVVWRQKDWEEKEEVLGSICVVITVCAGLDTWAGAGPRPASDLQIPDISVSCRLDPDTTGDQLKQLMCSDNVL